MNQYEDRVPQHVRDHTAKLMDRWTGDGRNDHDIEALVRSAVLSAYVEGTKEADRG